MIHSGFLNKDEGCGNVESTCPPPNGCENPQNHRKESDISVIKSTDRFGKDNNAGDFTNCFNSEELNLYATMLGMYNLSTVWMPFNKYTSTYTL